MTLPSPRRAYATFLANGEYPKEMVGWGVDALIAGASGSATTLLAGADFEEPSEVYRLFEKALWEQGIQIPSPKNRLEWLEVYICDLLISGDMTPVEASNALYRLWMDSDHDDRFARWLWFSESICLLEYGYGGFEPFEDMTLDTVDECLIREAKHVLKSNYDQAGPTNRLHAAS